MNIIIALFVIAIACNAYFRYRVMKSFNFLNKNKVSITAGDVLNKEKLENDIIPKYQEYEHHIRAYAKFLKIGFGMTSVMLILIIILGMTFFKTHS